MDGFPIILASTSPRRRELLAQLGHAFTVMSSEVDESRHVGEPPCDYIMRMVMMKADKAVCDVAQGVVITADTIGVINNDVLTKPNDRAHAFVMWDKLSDSTHQIWTAFGISVAKDHRIIHQILTKVSTEVTFVKLDESQKASYWATGEPVDKAGAYAIQGGAMSWVRSIHGSYTNVVGLPLAEVAEALRDCHAFITGLDEC